MNKAIIYKEWLKTRWFLLGAVAVAVIFTSYTILNLAKVVEFRGAATLWGAMVAKDALLVDSLRYIPLLIGGLLAIVQFVPEIVQKRLKLTLHLPYPQGKMIECMYWAGMSVLAVIFVLQGAAVAYGLSQWVVCELVSRTVVSVAVWYLAGFAAYTWIAAACLEPVWKTRVVIVLVLAGLFRLLFISSTPEAYSGIMPGLVVFVLCGQVMIFHSISRFKEGVQD